MSPRAISSEGPPDDGWGEATPEPTSRAESPLRLGDHVEVAQRLAATLRARSETVYTDGSIYRYSVTGIFEPMAKAELSQLVQGYSGIPCGPKGRPLELRASDVRGAIELANDQLDAPDFFAQARPGICSRLAFIEVTADQIAEHEHSAGHRARYSYPWTFRPHARPERFLAFLGDIFRDDSDKLEKIALIQEYFGACILGIATRYQRVLVFVGDGANGKGALSAVIARCMPPGSVSAIAPQDLGQEYRRALLAGKLLNIVSELPEADLLDSESWKAVVAGDTVTGREIRKSPFTFTPIAGHIYSANRLPGTSDLTHGFWRRIMVVRFSRIFQQADQDPDVADRIVRDEAALVVSWALRGAQRLLANGRYTVPGSTDEAVDAWKLSADQVRGFVEDKCERLRFDAPPADGTQAQCLYSTFKSWAQDNGHRPMNSNKFAERMRLLSLGAHRMSHGRYYPVRIRGEQ